MKFNAEMLSFVNGDSLFDGSRLILICYNEGKKYLGIINAVLLQSP